MMAHSSLLSNIDATQAQQTEQARFNMVEGQLRPNRVISEELLQIMGNLKRECFAAKGKEHLAYADTALPLGNDRFLLSPLQLGRLLQEVAADNLLQDKENRTALEIGAGSAYGAAVLSGLGFAVDAVEEDGILVTLAQQALAANGVQGVNISRASLQQPLSGNRLYDVILVAGAVANVPEQWLEKLAENGRLLVIKRDNDYTGHALSYRKFNGFTSASILFDAVAPWLPSFTPQSGFTL
ncbi:MAG: protein-L-isoaspartate O-methyltransferase family protein [Alphaproteobacteria bacterium]